MTIRRGLIWAGVVVLGLVLVVFPFLGADLYYVRVLGMLFMYIGLAESWNLLGGYTGYLSLGHVVFFGIGAYTSAVLFTQHGISPFITAPLAGVLAALVALIIGYPTLRLRGPYFAVLTLSVAFVAQELAANTTQVGGGLGIEMQSLPFDIRTTESIFYWAFLVLAVIVVAVAYKLERSRFGLSLLAVKNDEDVAEVFGVNTTRAKLITLVLSAFFPGVIGALYSYHISYIDPGTTFDVGLSINLVLMTLLGGSGLWMGPVIGATIVYLASQAAAAVIPSALNRVLYGVVLVVVIYAIPRGILGMFERRRPMLGAGKRAAGPGARPAPADKLPPAKTAPPRVTDPQQDTPTRRAM